MGHGDAEYFVIVCRFGVDVVSLKVHSEFLFSLFATGFLRLIVTHWGLQWDRALFADPDRRGSIHQGLKSEICQCGFLAIVSLSPGHIVRRPTFSPSEASISPSSTVMQIIVSMKDVTPPTPPLPQSPSPSPLPLLQRSGSAQQRQRQRSVSTA